MSETARPRDVVLVVDDSPDTLRFLMDALDQAGVTVLVATGGGEALALVDQITPDIVLLDAVMPVMDGFETCRRLKAMRAVAHVPVIFMTGLTETEHIVEGLEAGGVDYLTKPIVLEELFARIRVHLANARTAQSARVALDSAGRFLLAVDAEGTVLWSTPQAVRLLDQALPQRDGVPELPAELRRWIAAGGGRGGDPASFAVERADGAPLRFSFVGAVAGELLFRIVSADAGDDLVILRRRFPLTQREAEVLIWIARGKSNRDIAEILALSPRTVNKHLEQIYAKLGVENRASAAVVAMGALGGG